MPNSISTSPTRVVMNALMAAWNGVMRLGSGYVRANQKPMRRYEQRPITSQPTKSSSRLSATTSASIAAANRLM